MSVGDSTFDRNIFETVGFSKRVRPASSESGNTRTGNSFPSRHGRGALGRIRADQNGLGRHPADRPQVLDKTGRWGDMPFLMLAKYAEAQAFRKDELEFGSRPGIFVLSTPLCIREALNVTRQACSQPCREFQGVLCKK
jgi:hypothetical protein